MEMKEKNLTIKRPIRLSAFSPLLSHLPSWLEEGFGEDFETMKSANITLSEDEKNIYVEANLPGLQEGDVEMTLDKDTLWIKGCCKQCKEESNRQYYYKASREYSYRITLPSEVDHTDEPSAKLENGVIRITFKKTSKGQPRKINISK